MLADKMQHRVMVLSQFMAPQGQRPPFTKQLEDQTALKWWSQHRYDEFGARVLQGMSPTDIAELDSALAQNIDQKQTMV